MNKMTSQYLLFFLLLSLLLASCSGSSGSQEALPSPTVALILPTIYNPDVPIRSAASPIPSETSIPLPTGTTPPTPTVEISSVALQGDGLVQLSFSPADEYTASLSTDQSRLAYSSLINDAWQIIEADPNTGEVIRQVTQDQYNYHAPRYSQDGSLLLANSDRDGDQDIYLVSVESGKPVSQLTTDPGDDYAADWLPGDVGIIWTSDRDGLADIYMSFLDGVNLKKDIRVTKNASFDGYGSVSHDGELIAFQSLRDGNYEIYIIDISKRTDFRVTFDPGRDADPVLSPDGQWVIFESNRGGNYDLYAVNTSITSQVRNLTNHPANDQTPMFSPDGKWLLFQSDRNGSYDIYRIPWT